MIEKENAKTDETQNEVDSSKRNIVAALLGSLGVAALAGCTNQVSPGSSEDPESIKRVAEAITGTQQLRWVSWIGTSPGAHDLNLRNLDGPTHGEIVIAEGFWEPGDGGGGIFYWDETSCTDDGGTTIVPNTNAPVPPNQGSSGACWKRIYSGPLNVKWFGAKGNGSTNDTSAIQRAIVAAEAIPVSQGTPPTTSISTVYVPRGNYKLDAVLSVGGWTNVVGEYGAILCQDNANTDVLAITHFRNLIRGVTFFGGRRQISICNANVDQSSVWIELCEFRGSFDFAIWCKNDYGVNGDYHLSTHLTIHQCRFIWPKRVLYTWCDQSQVKDCWVSVDRTNFDPDSAVFDNRSGRLLISNLLGVPTMGTGQQRLPYVRWIDQHATPANAGIPSGVWIDDTRFGGEDNGMAIIYNFAGPPNESPWMGPVVSIKHTQLCAGPLGGDDTAVIVIKGQIPQYVSVRDNIYLIQAPYFANPDSLDLTTYFAGFSPEVMWNFAVCPNMDAASPAMDPKLFKWVDRKTEYLLSTLLAGNNNDLEIPASFVRVNQPSAGGAVITGIKGGVDGREITFLNVTTGNITFAYWDSASDAPNRFLCKGGSSVAIPTHGIVTFIYSTNAGGWLTKSTN